MKRLMNFRVTFDVIAGLTIGAVSVALAGCAFAQSPKPDPETYPTGASDIIATSKDCSNRAVAIKGKDLENFKYGCFCGENHPDMRKQLTNPESELSPSKRAKIVRSYLSIKPIDDIDRACQAHDICWTQFGRQELSCNDHFYFTLKDFLRAWNETRSYSDMKSDSYVCHDLANDMSNGTLIFMKGTSDNSSDTFWAKFIGFFGFPNGVLVGGLTKVSGAIMNTYPTAIQRCNSAQPTRVIGPFPAPATPQ